MTLEELLDASFGDAMLMLRANRLSDVTAV